MADERFVVTPERIHDPELERYVYGAGDRVPIADAVKYGLLSEAEAKATAKPAGDDWPAKNVAQEGKPRKAAAKKTAAKSKAPARKEDRAHRPAGNR